MTEHPTPSRVATGVPGLDVVLQGGLIPDRSYLVRGGPGSGKTTLGLHFLTAGTENGETPLFITLGEPEDQIRHNAKRLGLALEGVDFLDLTPSAEFFSSNESYDVFSPSEVEGESTARQVVDAVAEAGPRRVFIDSMTQFRNLAPDAYRFRKQVLSLLRYLQEQGVTVLVTSEDTGPVSDHDLQFMVDGVLDLVRADEGRVLAVTKFRGSDFEPGRHPIRLTDRGMRLSPRLVPGDFDRDIDLEPLSTGLPDLDRLLGGGLERGSVTIVTGPSGVGKTTVGVQLMKEAASRGEPSVIYAFEESKDVLLARCESVNIPAREMIAGGMLRVRQIEPLRHAPDEFAAMVRTQVEEEGARIVMIDSIAGYRLALKGSELAPHLHALCKYLGNMGVAAVITNEVESITGHFRATEAGISFLADNILFLRYIEIDGRLGKAIGVLKKRLSSFENHLRQLEITPYGIKVGEPLTGLRGVFDGSIEMDPDAGSGGRLSG